MPMLMKKNPGGKDEEELTPEEKDRIYRLIEEKEREKKNEGE